MKDKTVLNKLREYWLNHVPLSVKDGLNITSRLDKVIDERDQLKQAYKQLEKKYDDLLFTANDLNNQVIDNEKLLETIKKGRKRGLFHEKNMCFIRTYASFCKYVRCLWQR